MEKLFSILIILSGLFAVLETSAAANNAARERKVQSECRLTEEGEVADGAWKQVRVELAGQPVTGADTLEQAVEALNELRDHRLCETRTQDCAISGEGVIGGQWQKHRIILDGVAVAGARDLGSLSEKVDQLRQSGVCN